VTALLLVSSMLVWTAGMSGAAPAGRTYANPTLHYRLVYPAAWVRLAVGGSDFAVSSRDHNATFSISTTVGQALPAALGNAILLVYKPFGKPEDKPVVGYVTFGHTTGVASQVFVRGANGVRRLVLVASVSYRRHIYTLIAVVANWDIPPQNADYEALNSIIMSLRLI
jgi:hypothetical protein